MKLNRKYKGSMTIEASLVMPLVFVVIAALIYIGIILYQKVYLQSLADFLAERTAATWSSSNKDILTGQRTADQSKDSLYTALYDYEKGTKMEKLQDFCDKYMDKYSILKSASTNKIKPEVTNYIFYKKVTVDINASYKVPGGGIFRIVGMNSGAIPINIKSESIVNDQVEFIRNTDFIIDTANKLAETNGTANSILTGYDKLLEKLNKAVEKLGAFTKMGEKK